MTTPQSTFAERCYRLLLRAYPRAFREHYGAEMLWLFREMYVERQRRAGAWGIMRFWGEVMSDFGKTAGMQHLDRWLSPGEHDLVLAGKGTFAMTLNYTFAIGQRTDIGLTRESNEDTLLSVVPEDAQLLQTKGALFVVSDGMGGHDRGEVASQIAVQHVSDAYYQNQKDAIPTALQEAMKAANAAVYDASEKNEEGKANMGATCVAAVVHDQHLYAANVGDSRVYVLHGDQLRQVTRDHSIVAQMVERGEITAEQARTHEQRNIIYRSLGMPTVEVDLFTESVEEGDTLILCTDGLSSVLDEASIRAIVERYGPEESAEQLIVSANAAGGPDNVTAIVVRVSAA